MGPTPKKYEPTKNLSTSKVSQSQNEYPDDFEAASQIQSVIQSKIETSQINPSFSASNMEQKSGSQISTSK